MAPTFGDLDGDGDKDLIIGESNGRLHYFENLAGAGNTAVFGNHDPNYKLIDVGNFAYPQLFDIDKNGTLDLLIGSQNGKVTYYKNTGTITSANFSLQTAFLGNMDVRQYGYVTGYSMPFAFDAAGITKLLVGSEVGNMYLYDNIDGNLTGTFNRADTALFKINEGTRCAPFYEDITNDGKRDLVLGNYAGGLGFFNSTNINGVGVPEIKMEQYVSIYPNPANSALTIIFDDAAITDLTITLLDVTGKEIFNSTTSNKLIQLDVSVYAKGIYFLRIQQKNDLQWNVVTKKIVID